MHCCLNRNGYRQTLRTGLVLYFVNLDFVKLVFVKLYFVTLYIEKMDFTKLALY